jgi:hypothetical protein
VCFVGLVSLWWWFRNLALRGLVAPTSAASRRCTYGCAPLCLCRGRANARSSPPCGQGCSNCSSCPLLETPVWRLCERRLRERRNQCKLTKFLRAHFCFSLLPYCTVNSRSISRLWGLLLRSLRDSKASFANAPVTRPGCQLLPPRNCFLTAIASPFGIFMEL